MMCLKNMRIKTDHRRTAASLSPGSSTLNIPYTWGWPPFCDYIRIPSEKSPYSHAAGFDVGASELSIGATCIVSL